MEFSIKRIGSLLQMELRTWGRTILILGAIVTAVVVLFFEFSFGFFGIFSSLRYEEIVAFQMSTVAVPILMVFFWAFIYLVNRRVNRSKGMAYTVVPASIAEKFVSLLIVGLALFIVGLLSIQLCYLFELMMHPSINLAYAREMLPSDWIIRIGSFQLIDPISHFLHRQEFVSALSSIAFALFTGITFRRLRFGLGIYAAITFGIFILMAFVVQVIPMSVWQQWGDNYSFYYFSTPEEARQLFVNVLTAINLITAAVLGFFAYRNLKRKQL